MTAILDVPLVKAEYVYKYFGPMLMERFNLTQRNTYQRNTDVDYWILRHDL